MVLVECVRFSLVYVLLLFILCCGFFFSNHF
jgi:hypothetical protein